jgi:hypothetical protein
VKLHEIRIGDDWFMVEKTLLNLEATKAARLLKQSRDLNRKGPIGLDQKIRVNGRALERLQAEPDICKKGGAQGQILVKTSALADCFL